jgi:putative glycosyltransferase (TIGR04372 family)
MKNFFSSQIEQISVAGFFVLFTKIKNILILLYYIFFLLIFFPIYIITILISPYILIRFGFIYTSRIGHFVGNTELYLLESKEEINIKKIRHIDFFVTDGHISNNFLFEKYLKRIKILPYLIGYPSLIFFRFCNKFSTFFFKFLIPSTKQGDRDVNFLMEKFNSNFFFSNQEIDDGFNQLQRIGLQKNSRFVYLIVRDEAYLNENFKKDWSYHSYRDCSIHNYYKLAEELARNKIYTIRMGKKVKERFLDKNNNYLIDYANSEYKSDFLDIFLASKCFFAISTGCGLDSVPDVLFRKPILFSDVAPIGYLRTYSSRYLLTFKKYYSSNNGKALKLKEIFNNNLGYLVHANDYKINNIYLQESSPEELAEYAKEMLLRVEKKWIDNNEDVINQKLFWNTFDKNSINNEFNSIMHKKIHSIVSSNFLKTNKNIIL